MAYYTNYTNYTAYNAELYAYYTVLYRKISGLWHRYNTNSTNVTYKTRAPLRGSVSYQPKSDSDPALALARANSRLLAVR
jgi:hypothetical protein